MLLIITLLFLALQFIIGAGIKESTDVYVKITRLIECTVVLLDAIIFIMFYVAWHLGIR